LFSIGIVFFCSPFWESYAKLGTTVLQTFRLNDLGIEFIFCVYYIIQI
jgi:hypothetical protein